VKKKMKRTKILFALIFGVIFFASMGVTTSVQAKPQADFEIVMPWGTDHERGKIIMSMIGNHSELGSKYTYTYTAVGGGPSDRDALVARFLAGDYPDLVIATQDWYTEFAQFGIWHDFKDDISAWSDDTVRVDWREDIPAGWWSILDKANGDGTGDDIFALPFFGQSVLPYVNLDDLAAAGVAVADLDTLDGFMAAAKKLDDAGKVPFAQVGLLQSDIAYMNYMFASTDNFIDSSSDPATVLPWDGDKKYGVNGSLSVEGLAAYLKLKGEGWVPTTVDTDGGGQVNDHFKAGNTSMVLVGPWGTGIFSGEGGLEADAFKAIPMPKTSDGERSTITGGGMSLVPVVDKSAAVIADAAELASWLLDDENQMKTVDNWLNVAWRVPVRQSVASDPWFTAAGFPERANHIVHIESQVYAFPWGKQHPEWITIHESVMMPGYKNALQSVVWGQGYTDTQYTEMAQKALDAMAQNIEIFYLAAGKIGGATPGFEAPLAIFGIFVTGSAIAIVRKRKN
jgi:ABC-type glycerol-3-phosphate transport system substrate-binding protein